jgi:hypothetical protein
MKAIGKADNFVICVPSGNFGNITAALFGARMGLPVKRFIAANNANDIVYNYLKTGDYNPRPSIQTIANAMDVGDPSNFARILDLYGNSHERISAHMSGATYTDDEIRGMKKITCKIAADYLGIAPMAVSIGMQQNQLPIGFAIHHQDRYSDSWSYNIIAERLIAYNHGTINEVQVQGIERNLERIISEFSEMKKDLSFLLRTKQE